jgi:hypothetical protein
MMLTSEGTTMGCSAFSEFVDTEVGVGRGFKAQAVKVKIRIAVEPNAFIRMDSPELADNG